MDGDKGIQVDLERGESEMLLCSELGWGNGLFDRSYVAIVVAVGSSDVLARMTVTIPYSGLIQRLQVQVLQLIPS